MERQKTEMEKRITVQTITQLLQELDGLEKSLAESSDVELAGSFKDKQQQLTDEIANMDFEQETPASAELQLLRTEPGNMPGYSGNWLRRWRMRALTR